MSVTVKSIEDGNTSALESHDYDNVVRKRARSLLVRKDSQIAAAEAMRKAQIRNANQHYQYELRRAEGSHH